MGHELRLPEGAELKEFRPVAFYDSHMDCIRVLTHDRSVTEHRVDESFTVYECNHRSDFDPKYVGFTIKGIRHLFDEVGLDLNGVYTLTEIIDQIVRRKPGSSTAVMLDLIFESHASVGDLRVHMDGDLNKAA